MALVEGLATDHPSDFTGQEKAALKFKPNFTLKWKRMVLEENFTLKRKRMVLEAEMDHVGLSEAISEWS